MLQPRTRPWGAFCLLMAAGQLASCSLLQRPTTTPATHDLSTVSQGYTLLYEIVSQQKHIDTLLLIKVESDAVDTIISEMSAYSAKLEDQLVKLAKADPSLDLDRQILPAMFVRMHQSIQAEQLKDMLGATGKDFERLLLFNMSGPLNQARHLATVMHEAEPNEERKAFWKEVREQFDDYYRRVMALLEKRYFS
jgi:hypothetical protein